MNVLRCCWLAPAVAVLLLALSPGAAGAHILSLVSSEPASEGQLCTSARQITATFSGELDVKASKLVLTGSGGAAVAEGSADLNDVERARLLLVLPDALPEGRYTIEWKAVSNDDKTETTGSYPFTARSCFELPWWTSIALGGLTVVIGGVLFAGRRREQSEEEGSIGTEAAGPGGARPADA